MHGANVSVARVTSRTDLLMAYDTELRTRAEMAGTDSYERIGPLWAGVFAGSSGFVSYADLDRYAGARLDELIDTVIAHFERLGVESFEWKTRGHDAPADLTARLLARGLVAQDTESVMIGEAAGVAGAPAAPSGIVVRQVGAGGHDRRHDLERSLDMQRRVFGQDSPGSIEQLEQQLDSSPEQVSCWIAEDGASGAAVVTAGRINIVSGTQFAGIWGGATLPQYRGRGIYRALTAARARWAIERGVRYLHSDSTDMSRPILERSGLVAVTTTTPYIWTRDNGRS